MPYSSGHVEVKQLSVAREEFNYPVVSEGSGERNNGDASDYVGSTDEHACDYLSLTSGATPIPEEITLPLDFCKMMLHQSTKWQVNLCNEMFAMT
jgi:hypothetical protein